MENNSSAVRQAFGPTAAPAKRIRAALLRTWVRGTRALGAASLGLFSLSLYTLTACTQASQQAVQAPTPRTAPALQRLNLGVQAVKPDETRAAWLPLVQDMGRKLGLPTELLTASQGEIVKALQEGRVDVVWLSSNAAIDAVTQADARAFALYFNVNGTQGYKGTLITRSDSGIETLEQALTPGKYRCATGAKTSTSGYVLPQHFLFNPRGSSAEATFKTVTVGSHFDNLAALWAGQVDVAVNNSTDTAVFQASREPAAAGKLRVLWESPLVPNDVLMYRADMPAASQAALRQLFLQSYGQAATEKALYRQASGIRNFVAADNRLLEPVSQVKFATERAAIEANSTLPPAEKASALRALEQRIERFKASLGR
jgi:phosphonate transport system substrate-binding protein